KVAVPALVFTDTPKSCQPTAGAAEVQPCDWSWPPTYQWVCAAVRPARPSTMSISSPVVVLVIHHAGHAAAWPLAGGTNIRASNEPPARLNAHLESSSDPVYGWLPPHVDGRLARSMCRKPSPGSETLAEA